MKDSWQKYLAEGFGTFILVFVIAGCILANWQTGGALGPVGLAIGGGAVLAAMIYATQHISGAHLNPAVTFAMWATKNIKTMVGLGYIASQLIGAIAAAALLKLVFASSSPQFFLGDAVLQSGVTPVMGIVIEAILTFFLIWTYFSTIVDKKSANNFGGIAVGLIFAVCILVGGNLTMAALNPARSFGPALLSSNWTYHYVYWLGPLAGALIAAAVHYFSFGKKA